MKKLKIAFITNQLEKNYQQHIWEGVYEAANLFNISLFTFAGKSLCDLHQGNDNFNSIYSTINPQDFDGIIFLSGPLMNFVSFEKFNNFYSSFLNTSSTKIVSIGMELKGAYSVLIDNKSGFSELIHHQIQHHGCKTILFIKGPSQQKDAIERFEIFQDIMNENGIPLDDNLIIEADFSLSSAYSEVKKVLQKGLSFDTIIASNDPMARGAMQALEENGILIPYQVSVVGFDDIVEARFTTPPLTTVTASVKESGFKAVEIINLLNSNQQVETITTLPSTLVTRSSCGCHLTTLNPLEKHETVGHLLNKLAKEIGNNRYYSHISSIVLSLYNNFSTANLSNLHQSISAKSVNQLSAPYWYKILDLIDHRSGFENHKLFDELRNSVRVYNTLAIGRQQLEQDRYLIRLQHASAVIGSMESFDQLIESLANKLPVIQIPGFQMIIYNTKSIKVNELQWDIPKKSLSFAYSDHLKILSKNIVVTKDAILDPPDASNAWIILPLLNGKEQYGIIKLQYGTNQVFVYEMIRILISIAVKNITSIRREQSLTLKLQKTLRKLHYVNSELNIFHEPDSLSGYLTLKGFLVNVEKRIFSEKNLQTKGVLFYLKISNLKDINISFGKERGDEAIKRTTHALSTCFRKIDIFGRVSGNSFAVYTNIENSEAINNSLERIKNVIHDLNRNEPEYEIKLLSTSISHNSNEALDISELLHSARSALYNL